MFPVDIRGNVYFGQDSVFVADNRSAERIDGINHAVVGKSSLDRRGAARNAVALVGRICCDCVVGGMRSVNRKLAVDFVALERVVKRFFDFRFGAGFKARELRGVVVAHVGVANVEGIIALFEWSGARLADSDPKRRVAGKNIGVIAHRMKRPRYRRPLSCRRGNAVIIPIACIEQAECKVELVGVIHVESDNRVVLVRVAESASRAEIRAVAYAVVERVMRSRVSYFDSRGR